MPISSRPGRIADSIVEDGRAAGLFHCGAMDSEFSPLREIVVTFRNIERAGYARMIPAWLHLLSIGSLLAAALCAMLIMIYETRHPQRMWITNAVWPLAALSGSVPLTWGYFRYGRLSAADVADGATDKPFAVKVAEGASHCGSGCTLGDICAE